MLAIGPRGGDGEWWVCVLVGVVEEAVVVVAPDEVGGGEVGVGHEAGDAVDACVAADGVWEWVDDCAVVGNGDDVGCACPSVDGCGGCQEWEKPGKEDGDGFHVGWWADVGCRAYVS